MPGLDDVAFARAVVANQSASACIDPKRVFSAGFSNGAMMSEILACEAFDLVRAVASIAGVVEYRPGNGEGIAECDAKNANSSKNVPVLAIHGTADIVGLSRGALLGRGKAGSVGECGFEWWRGTDAAAPRANDKTTTRATAPLPSQPRTLPVQCPGTATRSLAS